MSKAYIVNIDGSDPFVADNENAIYIGLDDLEGGKDEDGNVEGKVIDSYKIIGGFRIVYLNNIGVKLSVVANETEYYK